jgi:hypothetical protein
MARPRVAAVSRKKRQHVPLEVNAVDSVAVRKRHAVEIIRPDHVVHFERQREADGQTASTNPWHRSSDHIKRLSFKSLANRL